MSTYKGAFSPDDKLCSTAVRLPGDTYNPSRNPRRVGGARNTNAIEVDETLAWVDADNSVGSGPVGSGRSRTSQKPKKTF